MLFRTSADQNLTAIHAMLDAWNAEADRFRQAATAARKGEAPTSLTATDEALSKLPPGSPQFAGLLQAQITAMALLESVGNSFDVLDRFVTEEIDGPTRIPHELRIAAE